MLRFSGFDDEWKTYKLKDLLHNKSSSISINQLDDNVGNYPLYGASGFLKCIDFYEMDSDYISIVKDGSGVGNISFHEKNTSVVNTSQYILPKENLNIHFIFYLLQTINLNKYKTGSTIPHIYFKDYSIEKVKIPKYDEQKKIGILLKNLDAKIEILDNKLQMCQNFKKYLMQQIFTQKLRFENYNEAIYKLSDLYSSKKGTGLSKDKLDEEGLNKCILYGELYTTYNEIIQDVKSKTNSQEGILSKVGDILIPSSTTTKGIDLVTASVILEENVLLSGDITILRSKNENIINNKFFAYYFTNNLVKDVSKLTQGSTIIHLYWKDFKKVKLALPPINEQNKCVDLFLKLDKKIDLINFQIQKMEEFKKGLLQQMFV